MIKKDIYVDLARYSVDYFITNKKVAPIPNDVDKELLDNRAGVFVTLKRQGQLRGCIGTISPIRESIAKEIIHNAISAAVDDPRFIAVQEGELKDLVYSVDVLFPPEKVESVKELDPTVFGVTVSKGFRKGLLLPNIDGINTVDEQLEVALQKAGISPRENYVIERFKVERHQ